ncbi:MAG: DUF5030 domain-containing protein [Bacteroidaceae bacterium]|nr:DUF5030 domain-containing protein [Bacteroidaceae bacterium]
MCKVKSILRLLLIVGTLFLTQDVFAQINVSVEMMKERYRQYMKGETVPIDSADEVVNCIYHPKKEFSNPRIDKSRTRNIDLLNLRTEEYPERRHFWSMVIEQKRIGRKHDGIKVPRWKRRKTWVQRHKYFYLDSIAGMARNELPQSIKDNYRKKNRHAYHAPALSGTFYAISDPLDMFGYVTALYFVDLPLDKGKFMHGRLLSRCFSHRSLLAENTMTFCETSTACLQALMRTFSHEITERYKAEAKEIFPREKKFDLLIYQNQNLTSDVELLSDEKDAVAELETLRHIIRSLPANYFPRFWTLDNQALPGFYVEATLKNGEWTFSTNRFVKPY